MAGNNFDSMSQLLLQINRIYANMQQYIEAISKAIESTEDIVTIETLNDDGTTTELQLPSFANIERRLKIFEQNLNALVGAGTGALDNSLYLQLVDEYGKVKTLVHMSLLNVPDKIASLQGSLANDNQVVALGNELDKATTLGLNVQLDVTGKVSAYMQKCSVTKFIMSQDMYAYFKNIETTYGRELTHTEFINALNDSSYVLDTDYEIETFISNLRPRRPLSQGAFNILFKKITGSNTMTVRLDTVTYSNVDALVDGNQTLKVGDNLATASGDVIFSIATIDVLSNTVQLVRESGLQMPSANLNRLVYVETSVVKTVDVPLRVNENFVAFLSPVHESYNTIADYSPAIFIDIRNLTIRLSDGQLINANSWALSQGDTNIGAYLSALSTDALPPAKYAIKPDKLNLDASTFKVVQLNNHLLDNVDKDKILQLYAQKRSLQQEISSLDSTLSNLQLQLNTQNYKNDNERKSLQTQYLSYSKTRAAKLETLQQVIDSMLDIDVAAYDALYDPKFRIRGFLPVQEPSVSRYTGAQNIIQFKIQYRYVSLNDVIAKADTFDVESADGTITTAAFSTWNEIFTPLRRKIIVDGQIQWETINASSIESICCNQLDVPITPNEKVQIRVKAIGEAGYPNVLNESDWSNIITITFPDSLAANAQFVALKDELMTDKQQVLLENMLQTKGIIEHVGDALTENQTYFAHAAQNLASGFFNDNMSRISVYQKMLDMDNTIKQLQDIIINSGSMLRVSIIDELQNETEILNGSTTVLYAGAYCDEFDITKSTNLGSIFTKQYYIKFTNIGSTPIDLYPKYHGTLNQWLPNIAKDNIYNAPIAPMTNSYANTKDADDHVMFWSAPKGSRQCNGQIVYLGTKSVSGTQDLYVALNKDTASQTILQSDNAAINTEADDNAKIYIAKNAKVDALNPYVPVAFKSNAKIDSFVLLTTSHPLWQQYLNAQKVGSEEVSKVAALIETLMNSIALQGTTASTDKQVSLEYTGDEEDWYLTESNAPKCMFVDNDKYTGGANTRGAYLTLNPMNQSAMQVQNSADDAALSIKVGESNAVLVPLLFQARMTDIAGSIDSTEPIDSANFRYTKHVNLNCWIGAKAFSFDVKIYMDFRSTSSVLGSIPISSMLAMKTK